MATRKSSSKEAASSTKRVRPAPAQPMYNSGMLNTAITAAREAGRLQLQAFQERSSLRISTKSAGDFVTEVDKQCEQIIVETLSRAYPTHGFIGEESGNSGKSDAQYVWVIDPLDGTTNFIHGIPHFAVSIALLKDGVPTQAVVYDPCKNEIFTATKGSGATQDRKRIRVSTQTRLINSLVATGFPFREDDDYAGYLKSMQQMMEATSGLRRMGSAALDLCWVANGRFDGYWERGIKIWDIAAGALIALEAGALVSDYSGESTFLDKCEIVAATPKIFPSFLNIIQQK